jgi:hypothetical protein
MPVATQVQLQARKFICVCLPALSDEWFKNLHNKGYVCFAIIDKML